MGGYQLVNRMNEVFSEIRYNSRNPWTKNEQDRHKFDRLLNNSQLHPDLINVLNDIGLEAVRNELESDSNKTIHVVLREPVIRLSVQLKIWDSKQVLLERSLKKCDMVALLLPDYLARNVAAKMRQKNYVNVGREALAEFTLDFNIFGYVPPELGVFVRLKAIKWAGIWQRWRNLIVRKTSRGAEDKEQGSDSVKAAIMTGNILVVFVVLLMGQSISVVSLPLEMLTQGRRKAGILGTRNENHEEAIYMANIVSLALFAVAPNLGYRILLQAMVKFASF